MRKIFICTGIFLLGLFLGTKNAALSHWFKCCSKKQIVSRCAVTEHKPFVLIIPSYNNGEWVEKNLSSIFEQKYDNFRVIYIDDASNDRTLTAVKALVAAHGQEHRVQIWHNESNKGAVENIYRAAHSCLDQEIIIICDGDDWLSHAHVLQRLNEKYADPNVWATYGSYIEYPSYSYTVANFASPLPSKVVAKNTVRSFSKEHWCISHMRTFYAGLFKQIRLNDILFEGQYYDTAADVAFMIPLAEMAGEHLHFVEDIFYIYNRASPLNDNKLRGERQRRITAHILSLSPYSRLSSPFTVPACDDVHLIGFSFNRPLQLYAFLESVQRYAKNLSSISVIFRTSSDAYERGYAEVQRAFPLVRFLRQGHEAFDTFKPMLMKLLQESLEKYVTCAVDDIILTDEIDFKEGARLLGKTGAYCFCYRLGHHVNYCYSLDLKQGVPLLVQVDREAFAWSFDQGKGDWNYKTTLDLAIYRTEDLINQWKDLKFVHPNSLETAWYLKEKRSGIGLCCKEAKMVNIPINKVHISSNRHMNSYSPEELLSKFNEGLKIDIDGLHQMKNRSAHIEYDVQFIRR
jgi:glycosyltransferase involved in cell wall biosynthesis